MGRGRGMSEYHVFPLRFDSWRLSVLFLGTYMYLRAQTKIKEMHFPRLYKPCECVCSRLGLCLYAVILCYFIHIDKLCMSVLRLLMLRLNKGYMSRAQLTVETT